MSYDGDFAAVYELFFPPDRSAEVAAIVDLLGPPPARVLELMAGTAELAVLLAQRGYEATAVDLSAAMIEVATERRQSLPAQVRVRLHLLQADVTRTQLTGPFDVAFAASGSWNLLPNGRARLAGLER